MCLSHRDLSIAVALKEGKQSEEAKERQGCHEDEVRKKEREGREKKRKRNRKDL